MALFTLERRLWHERVKALQCKLECQTKESRYGLYPLSKIVDCINAIVIDGGKKIVVK